MLVLVVVSTLSKVFGFARDIVLSNVYGAGAIPDAYLATLSIPDMFLDVFAHTAMIGFVPLAIDKLNRSRDELNSFATSVMKILLIIAALFALIMMLFPSAILELLAPGFEGTQRSLATGFLRVMSMTMLFRSLTSVFQSYLSTVKYFVPAAFLGIVLDVSIIAAIFVSKRFELTYLLPIGVVVGTVLQALFLSPFAIKKGFALKRNAPLFSKDLKALLVMSIPAMLSVGLMQISTLFNKALASGFAVGAITMLNHSSRISFFVENIIVASIVAVLYPLLSEYYVKGQTDMIKYSIGDAIDKIITFLLPASVGLAILAEPIIGLLFGHGLFTSENVKVTANLMTLQVIGILGIAIQTLLTRALFSMKKVKLSVLVSISLLVIYLSCSFVLSRIWGLYGIALGTGLSYTIGGLVYYLILNKTCGGLNVKITALTFAKAFFASAVMAAAVVGIRYFLPLHGAFGLVAAAGAGVVVYFVLAQLLSLKHASLKPLLRRFLRKRTST